VTSQKDVHAALAEEGAELDRMVAGMDPAQWALPTPAPGWTVKHQIAHLASVFGLAAMAAGDPVAFGKLAAGLGDDFDANVRAAMAPYLAQEPQQLLASWRAQRAAAERAVAAVPPDQMVPWLVRPLPPSVLAAAGMMELFGHGQDIADTLGIGRARTDRIRHLAGFVTRTWDFAYLARGLTPPDVEFRFELTGPSGARWEFGPADAAQRVSGPAVDLCLLATRRRHRDDLALSAAGTEADHWLDIAQAYRGSPGQGRTAGQFTDLPPVLPAPARAQVSRPGRGSDLPAPAGLRPWHAPAGR
jgi:uncharacterized protein (TIGR03084 family)